MSNTDSFIDEVNDEVRRDRFYALLKRYGWIAIVAVVLLVGGAAWNEYQKAQSRSAAETLGDATLAALSIEDPQARATALDGIAAPSPSSAVLLAFLTASEQVAAGNTEAAIETLSGIGLNGDVPAIYRDIAQLKSVTLQGADADANERRLTLEALAQPGRPLRLLAAEQLALIDIEQGEPQAAIDRYQSILLDAEVTTDLQQRALQVIVALGGDPDVGIATSTGAPAIADPLTSGTDGAVQD